MAVNKRDPAFLFYWPDVAGATMFMNLTESGCYLKLILIQRQYNCITIVQVKGILGDKFEESWPVMEAVLEYEPDAGKYYIPWLRDELDRKAQKSDKQRDNVNHRYKNDGETGSTKQPKKPQKEDTNVLQLNYNGNTNELPTVTVTETVTKGKLGNEEGGLGEEAGESEGNVEQPPDTTTGALPRWRDGNWDHMPADASRLPNRMTEIFLQTFTDYPRQDTLDYAACLQIAYQIAEQSGWPWESALNGHMDEVLAKWREIVLWTASDSWYSSKSLTFLSKHFQGLIQAKNNANKKCNSVSPASRTSSPYLNGIDPTEIERTGFGGPGSTAKQPSGTYSR